MAYADYEWYLKNDLSKYSGKWLAIVDNKVVADDIDLQKVIKVSQKRFPNKRPFVTKIKDKLQVL